MTHQVIDMDCHNVHQIHAAGGAGGLNPATPVFFIQLQVRISYPKTVPLLSSSMQQAA